MMSHRRRLLNLLMRNDLTGMYSLHRINLLSRQNNLFYPTPHGEGGGGRSCRQGPGRPLLPGSG